MPAANATLPSPSGPEVMTGAVATVLAPMATAPAATVKLPPKVFTPLSCRTPTPVLVMAAFGPVILEVMLSVASVSVNTGPPGERMPSMLNVFSVEASASVPVAMEETMRGFVEVAVTGVALVKVRVLPAPTPT